MKNFILAFFACLILNPAVKAQLSFQDTTFTDPVEVFFASDFVTFENCRFVNIAGDALTIVGSGVFISNCTFENISGRGVVAQVGEFYMVNDTMRQISDAAIEAEESVAVVIGGSYTYIYKEVMRTTNCAVVELTDAYLYNIGAGLLYVAGSGEDELKVSGATIRNVTGYEGGPSSSALSIDGPRSLLIENTTIDSVAGWGIRLIRAGTSDPDAEELVIQGNTISHTGRDGIFGDLEVFNAVIRQNELSHAGFTPETLLFPPGGIYWNSPGARIEENHIHHMQNGTGGSGIFAYNAVTISRNHIHHCRFSGVAQIATPGRDISGLSLMFNNIIHDVDEAGIQVIGGNLPAEEPTACIIRNNTIHIPYNGTSVSVGNIGATGNHNPVLAEGNILIYEGWEGDSSVYVQAIAGDVLDRFNLKTTGDIDFVDFAGRNFHLASDASPAHNFLPANFGQPNDDYDGQVRIGVHDAGADELPLPETACGCVNCPSEVPELFQNDYTFTVAAADNNNLASATQGVCGVRVSFQHDYVGDLTMELISPFGQKVLLVGPAGFFGSTTGTTWDVQFVSCDSSASPDPGFVTQWSNNQNWGSAGTYTGIYYPSFGCLEDLNIGSVIGNWTLRVKDNQVQDMGVVNGFEVMFCDPNGVSCTICNEPPVAGFSVNAAGAWGAAFTNQSVGNAIHYFMDFGDGQVANSGVFPNFHEYATAGNYTVRLIVANDCGLDTMEQNIFVAGALPVAFAFATPETICAGAEVQLQVTNDDHVNSWHWSFPGGIPSESFDKEPLVTYPDAGIYAVSLTIENEVGQTVIPDIATVTVLPGLLNPSYSVAVIGDSIVCTSNTSDAGYFAWHINNQVLGQNQSPFVYEVPQSGLYLVGYEVGNTCDTLLLVDTVSVIISGIQLAGLEHWQVAVSPNPGNGHFELRVDAVEATPAVIEVGDLSGAIVYRQQTDLRKGKQTVAITLTDVPAGTYLLQLDTAFGRSIQRLVIVH